MNQPPSRRRKKATPAASDDSTLPNDLAEKDISLQENAGSATCSNFVCSASLKAGKSAIQPEMMILSAYGIERGANGRKMKTSNSISLEKIIALKKMSRASVLAQMDRNSLLPEKMA
jgi:hypothetical protein